MRSGGRGGRVHQSAIYRVNGLLLFDLSVNHRVTISCQASGYPFNLAPRVQQVFEVGIDMVLNHLILYGFNSFNFVDLGQVLPVAGL